MFCIKYLFFFVLKCVTALYTVDLSAILVKLISLLSQLPRIKTQDYYRSQKSSIKEIKETLQEDIILIDFKGDYDLGCKHFQTFAKP